VQDSFELVLDSLQHQMVAAHSQALAVLEGLLHKVDAGMLLVGFAGDGLHNLHQVPDTFHHPAVDPLTRSLHHLQSRKPGLHMRASSGPQQRGLADRLVLEKCALHTQVARRCTAVAAVDPGHIAHSRAAA